MEIAYDFIPFASPQSTTTLGASLVNKISSIPNFVSSLLYRWKHQQRHVRVSNIQFISVHEFMFRSTTVNSLMA
jgi:hypothetical protein